MGRELRVIATAGHVDHGKSSLLQRLTGMDPDRFEEEKRRGLTIDLGYAWCSLPSGRDVGFVDVPGHERFIRNMLAGVGPVRLVLFVVAADEGWKPQSEEHLQIVDVLGVGGAVIALTKRDLVDDEALELARAEILDRIAGTALAHAPVVAVSSRTGEGLDGLLEALDAMVGSADPSEITRPRLFVDRVFAIKGAGTVVTGTLAGDCLTVGQDVALFPRGRVARIRSLQTHKQEQERACPVSRVAANLVGVDRDDLDRGDVLGLPATWRPTATFEAVLRPVRDLPKPLTGRGAFQVHAGAAEANATVRFLDGSTLEPGGRAYARIKLSRPLVLDVFDRFVVREAGRRRTVAGGTVLDVAPPRRPGPAAVERLVAREASGREDLPELLVQERGAIRADEAELLTGASGKGPHVDGWLIREDVLGRARAALTAYLADVHRDRPLEEGATPAAARDAIATGLRAPHAEVDPDLARALLEALVGEGVAENLGGTLRLPSHRVALEERSGDVERLLEAIDGTNQAAPPDLAALERMGIARDVVEAASRRGLVVRVGPDLVFTPTFVARAEGVMRAAGDGITVSAFRAALGTSRKYAVPLLEWFDARGVSRREGDLRFPSGR